MNRVLSRLVLAAVWIALPAFMPAIAQTPWSSSQSLHGSAPAFPWFPFGAQAPGISGGPTAAYPWQMQSAPVNPGNSWNAAPAYHARPQPGIGFPPFGSPAIGGGSGMGLMMAPMMGFMAPMMGNYAIASMNPMTMTNFFGLMANPGGGVMPFGGFGSSGGGYANMFPFAPPTGSFALPPAAVQAFPWSQSQSPQSTQRSANTQPAFPPFLPFTNQAGQQR